MYVYCIYTCVFLLIIIEYYTCVFLLIIIEYYTCVFLLIIIEYYTCVFSWEKIAVYGEGADGILETDETRGENLRNR
jgi:predicted small integral membrane protein